MKARLFIRKNIIFFGIGLTILLMGASSLITFYGQYQSARFNKTKEEVEKTNGMIDYIFLSMNEMDKSVRGYMVIPDEKFLNPYNAVGKAIQSNFDTLAFALEKQNFPNMQSFVKAKIALAGYHEDLGKIISLKKHGDEEESMQIYKEDRGGNVWGICHVFATQARAFEQDRYEVAKARYEAFLGAASIMQALLIIVGIPTLIFVIYQIRKSEKLRRQLFRDLTENQGTYLFASGIQQFHQDEQGVISSLIENLQKAAAFIKEITRGNYTVHWSGLDQDNQADNEHNLAGALVQMREQMKAVKQQDQQRMWTTEGLSKVAEITRAHQQDAEQLADRLLSFLVNYLHANQGSLFFLQEDVLGEASLRSAACYAYDKKKHVEKIIKPGQGLVGQTFLEMKTLHLKRVPPDYVQITSGLGEATPTALLVVPLTFSGQVLGILEMASFQAFATHQITFLETVGEVIASAVATVRMNAQTKELLAQSQEGTEALRAQEEEMRQNMEELQATQEEMQRKAQEYEAVIEEQKKVIECST